MNGRVLTRLQRVAKVLSPEGEVIVIPLHACQSEATVEDMATRQLERPWQSRDMLILLEQTDSCSPKRHEHQQQRILRYRRTD